MPSHGQCSGFCKKSEARVEIGAKVVADLSLRSLGQQVDA
jgi:hypothetical protein